MFARGRNKRGSTHDARLLEPAYVEVEPQLEDPVEVSHPFADPAPRKPWDFPFEPPPLGPEDLAERTTLPRFFRDAPPRPLFSSV